MSRSRPSSFSNESEKFSEEKKKYRFDFSDGDRFNLEKEDVVSGLSWRGFNTPPMLKLSDLIQAILSWIRKSSGHSSEHEWFSEQGCTCEVLLARGGGWQKGRFRFRLEFIPDNPNAFLKNPPPEDEEPQSPLDDLRSQLDTQ